MGFLSPMTLNDPSNSKALAGLRIAVGALFLIFGEYKVFRSQFTSGGGFQYWINRFVVFATARMFSGQPARVPVPLVRKSYGWFETEPGQCERLH